MSNSNFTTRITVDQSPMDVFEAVTNVSGWWSEEIKGSSREVNDEFEYTYNDVHRCTMRLTEVIPGKKVVWRVLDNFFSFTDDKTEWIGTHIIFDIHVVEGKTVLQFTHDGLVPAYECYNACVNGWTQYINQSLCNLITTGKGQPNTSRTAYTIHEVAALFHELAQQEKWFDIQGKLFADDVRSIEPANSPYLQSAEGKEAVQRKGQDWVKRIEIVHRTHTTAPVVGGTHFAVGREMDITIQVHGRIQLNEIIVYQVKNGKIISEQFFYA